MWRGKPGKRELQSPDGGKVELDLAGIPAKLESGDASETCNSWLIPHLPWARVLRRPNRARPEKRALTAAELKFSFGLTGRV